MRHPRVVMTAPKVVYFPVHDLDYPRNRLIRQQLADHGFECQVVSRGHGAFEKSTWRQRIDATLRFMRLGRRGEVVFLSEMSIQYALLAWIVAKIGGAVLVVDGFIGLHETRVLDWKRYRSGSLVARLLWALDWLAFQLADFYVVDTDVRGKKAVAAFGKTRAPRVFNLPVGAPKWARSSARDDSGLPTKAGKSSEKLHLLHYGNYAPLHGVPIVLESLALLSDAGRAVHLTLVGEGEDKGLALETARNLGILEHCTFVNRVSERSLLPYLWECDAMLGVFGESEKAASVIPNKVWQGLAAGVPVITRGSGAYDEIREYVGEQLVEVAPGDPAALADAIGAISSDRDDYCGSADRLQSYVRVRFSHFMNVLRAEVERRGP